MKNNYNIYNIVVHTVNLILLGAIGLLAFFSVVNISPNRDSDMFGFGIIVFLLVMWAINYWFQYKKQKWILPIAGTVLYVAIAFFILDVGLPFLREIGY